MILNLKTQHGFSLYSLCSFPLVNEIDVNLLQKVGDLSDNLRYLSLRACRYVFEYLPIKILFNTRINTRQQ